MPQKIFAQLGTTIFDGATSFVSFSDDEEAVVVEHALINRKAKLQGTAIGRQNISLSLFLHQEYCKVSDEIDKLRASKNTFEILPLLWGNGRLEGNFVITTISTSRVQMDDIGNTIAASVSVTLKETDPADAQQKARDDAFGTGDKKPPTKSKRKNPSTCAKQISDIIFIIKTNADRVDVYSRSYTSDPLVNNKMFSHLNIIAQNSQKIITATSDPKSCVYNNTKLNTSSTDVKAKATTMQNEVFMNINRPGYDLTFHPDIAGMKSKNSDLQAAVKTLQTSANSISKSAILKK